MINAGSKAADVAVSGAGHAASPAALSNTAPDSGLPEKSAPCELCSDSGGEVLVSTADFRVVLVDDPLYPGFCRVVWHAHVTEMTELGPAQRSVLMAAVCRVELALREALQPHKLNLASLGNMTPHLHWHVIPRFTDDAHFPTPVWAAPVRTPDPLKLAARYAQLPALRSALARHFSASDFLAGEAS